jgi:hypothetical protein
LTTLGRLLLASSAGSFAGEGGVFFETIYRPLGALMHMVRTGEVAFDHVYGMSFYEYLSSNPAVAAFFYRTMTCNAPSRYAGLSSVYDFANISRVIDVGGGEGALMVQTLQEHVHLTGALLDLPPAIDRARARLKTAGISDRCELIAGDFLKEVPRGGDLYLLAQVLNNWRDDDARRILMNCRSAMGNKGRLLALETVYIPGSPTVPWRALVSLGVMAQRGGRSRSESQLRALFESVQFRVDELRPFPSGATWALQASPAWHAAVAVV